MHRLLALLLLTLPPGTAAATDWLLGDSAASAPAPTANPFRAEVVSGPLRAEPGEAVELHVLLHIPAEHYVYAERTGLEILPAPGVEVLEVRGPVPQTKRDPFLEEDVQVHAHDAEFVARVRVASPTTLHAVSSYQGCNSKMCFFPQSDTLAVAVAVGGRAATTVAGPGAGGGAAADRLNAAAGRGILWLLLAVFGAGVATSFTPCIYPMIPITIGIIGARSAGRRSKGFTLSLLYVLGLAVTYSALGTSAALTGSVFGSVLQNRWVVVGVALVFAAMAMSLFGAFEMQVPAGLAGRMNRVQGSGYPGAFLFGLVAGIVASPCVAPVLVGMLTLVARNGSPLYGFAVFFAFALGLGLLFIVLGTFTGVLTSLPRSGNWMTRIKIGFGLVFLGVALYYVHPILPHERWLVPIGAGLLAGGLALGALRTIHEAEPARARWRKALGRTALAAGLYAAVVPLAAGRGSAGGPGPTWLVSESEGLRVATAGGRPMLVDFSAAWCVACKELERYTFSDARVIDLARGFVTVRVDATRRTPEIDALMRKYRIRGLPWVAFVAADGTILHDLTVTGFVDADAMLARMRQALPETAPAGS